MKCVYFKGFNYANIQMGDVYRCGCKIAVLYHCIVQHYELCTVLYNTV